MRKHRLGTSDLYVSEIGLGLMSIGTDEARRTALFMKHWILASTSSIQPTYTIREK